MQFDHCAYVSLLGGEKLTNLVLQRIISPYLNRFVDALSSPKRFSNAIYYTRKNKTTN